MKKRESKEPDLYVINKKLTEKEKQEIIDFIEAYKLRQKLNSSKHRKVA